LQDFANVPYINAGRRNWLGGYANEKDEKKTKEMYKNKANHHSDVDKTYSKSYGGFHGKEAGISLDDREDEHDYSQKESKKNSTDGDNNDDEMKWKEYWAETT
jgi:hypothetical protein